MGFPHGCPRERRVLFVVADSMVSKRWLEGKGRISRAEYPGGYAGGTAPRDGFRGAKQAAIPSGKSRRQGASAARLRIYQRNRNSSGGGPCYWRCIYSESRFGA